jgi:AcrR family transcriptional regulator
MKKRPARKTALIGQKRMRRTADLSREMWLNAAYTILESEGVEQIKIERLGRMLDLTKGSFYGQFKDRNELLQALLDHWREEMLSWVKVARDNQVDDIAANLRFILHIIEKNAWLRFDSALRIWAKQDPDVAKVVKEIDTARISYLLDIFAKGGITGEEARARADVFYGFTIFVGIARSRPFSKKDIRLFERAARWISSP